MKGYKNLKAYDSTNQIKSELLEEEKILREKTT